MDYLSRESAPWSDDLWKAIDEAVVSSAKKQLIGRKFLSVFGPVGSGVRSAVIDSQDKTEEIGDGIAKIKGRQIIELPQIFNDFWLYWRDIEHSEKAGYPVDVSAAMTCAERVSRAEDNLIFFGNSDFGIQGLYNAKGVNKKKLSDWYNGEDAFKDIAAGLTLLDEKGMLGDYALVLSPDLHLALQRLQPGMSITEIDRVSKMIIGRGVFRAPALGSKKALLVCCEPQYMDVVIGQDMAASYLELVDLNHHLRVLETIAPRVKQPQAIVAYG